MKGLLTAGTMAVIMAFSFTFGVVDDLTTKMKKEGIVEKHRSEIVTVMNGHGHGTGFFFDDDLIVTNQHVVANIKGGFFGETLDGYAKELKVVVDDFQVFDAELLFVDDENDLALLRVKTDKVEKTMMPNLLPLQLDQDIYTIGNGGSNFKIPKLGKVKSMYWINDKNLKHNLIYYIADMPIIPGDSGSPVFDDGGNLIGVVSRGGGDKALFIQARSVLNMIHKFNAKARAEAESSAEEALEKIHEAAKKLQEASDAVHQ